MQRYTVTLNGKRWEVTLLAKAGSRLDFEVSGRRFAVEVEPRFENSANGSPKPVNVTAHSSGEIQAPMPGIISSVLVSEGQRVKAGETVVVIEAMKMENNIPAVFGGVVTAIHVGAGQEVNNGQRLVTIEAHA